MVRVELHRGVAHRLERTRPVGQRFGLAVRVLGARLGELLHDGQEVRLVARGQELFLEPAQVLDTLHRVDQAAELFDRERFVVAPLRLLQQALVDCGLHALVPLRLDPIE